MRGLIRYSGLSASLFALLVTCSSVSGQTGFLSAASHDTVKAGDAGKSSHSLYAGAGYGSNMIWLGSTISGDLPFYSSALTYGFNNSLYISASASDVIGLKPFPAFYTLSSNYSHTFNKWFDISADLGGYKTRESLQDTLFSDFGYISLTAGFDWKILYTRISLNSVLSEDIKGYIQIINSRYFQTGDFFNGDAYISFDPEFSVLAGEIIETVTTTGTRKFGLSPPFRHFKRDPGTTTTVSYTSKFGLMDFELSLPVAFNYKNISFEVEPSYILPAYKDPEYPAPNGFSVYLSAYIKIF